MAGKARTAVALLGVTVGAALLVVGAAGAMGMGWWAGQGPWGMMGPGMMGTWPGPQPPPNAAPLTAEQVAEQVRSLLPRWGDPGLQVGHIMEFDNGFYVIVEGADGTGAFELLVDRYGTWVRPEPGPNMMWNTRYGHMGAGRVGVPGSPTIGPEQALQLAQAYLDRQMPGATAGELTEFPGYYTIDVASGGRTSGMLSVNAYTGAVWYHTWHGAFLAETEPAGEHGAGDGQ